MNPGGEASLEHRLLNRELSWLDFNDRVLALAERDDVPLLERAKFLAIFSQNHFTCKFSAVNITSSGKYISEVLHGIILIDILQ